MTTDKFKVEILADGTFKVTTDKVSSANHVNAENLLREMFKLAGGPCDIKHRHGKQIHHHSAENIQSLEAGSHKH